MGLRSRETWYFLFSLFSLFSSFKFPVSNFKFHTSCLSCNPVKCSSCGELLRSFQTTHIALKTGIDWKIFVDIRALPAELSPPRIAWKTNGGENGIRTHGHVVWSHLLRKYLYSSRLTKIMTLGKVKVLFYYPSIISRLPKPIRRLLCWLEKVGIEPTRLL